MITGAATTGTVVAGNLIGTDVEGTAAVGNLTAGIVIAGGTGTTIGGTTVLARNVISGNAGDGVDVGSGATNTLIQGNYIGMDQTGTKPLGNTGDGRVGRRRAGRHHRRHGAGRRQRDLGQRAGGRVDRGDRHDRASLILGNRIGTD